MYPLLRRSVRPTDNMFTMPCGVILTTAHSGRRIINSTWTVNVSSVQAYTQALAVRHINTHIINI